MTEEQFLLDTIKHFNGSNRCIGDKGWIYIDSICERRGFNKIERNVRDL